MNAFSYPSKRGINFAKIRGFKVTDYNSQLLYDILYDIFGTEMKNKFDLLKVLLLNKLWFQPVLLVPCA